MDFCRGNGETVYRLLSSIFLGIRQTGAFEINIALYSKFHFFFNICNYIFELHK
jgi:hypothetical protein